MNFGLVLGGAAQGFNAAEELKVRKAKDKREAETHDEEMRRAEARRRGEEILKGKRPKVGEEYDGSKANPWDAFEVQPEAPAPQKMGRLERGLHRIIPGGPDIDAAPAPKGRGLVDPQLAAEAPVPEGAMSAAPKTGGLDIPPADAEVSEVTVEADTSPKVWTDADENAFQARAYAEMGEHQLASQYGEKAMKSRVNEQLKDLAKSSTSLSKLANVASDATGQDYDFEQGEDGSITVTVDGEPAGTFRNRTDLVFSGLKPMIDGDLAAGFTATMELTKEDRQERELQNNIEYKNAMVGLEKARVAISDRLAKNTIANGAMDRELQGLKIDALKNFGEVLEGKGDPLLMDGAATQAAEALAVINPDVVYTKEVEDANGETRLVRGNKYEDIYNLRRERAEARFNENKYVQAGVISIVPDPRPGMEGRSLFQVKGSEDGHDDLNDAEMEARRKFKLPKQK